MSFKNKKKRKLKNFNLFDKQNKLEEAVFLIEGERFHEAVEFLEEAIEKYPKEVQFWEMLAFAASETMEITTIQKAFGKLTEMKKDNPDNWIALATSYDFDGRVALAHKTYQKILTRFPEDVNIKEVQKGFDFSKNELERIFKDYGFVLNEKDLEIACRHEMVQVLMNQDKFDEAIELARKIIKEKPEFVPALNNLSLVLFMNGDVQEAAKAAQKVLDSKPENFHALGNLVRYSVFLGHQEEAQELVERLKKVKSDDLDIFIKKIEAFSFLGDDEAVVEIYEGSNNLNSEFMTSESHLKHLVAFAFYRLGDEKKAEKLWEEIIEEDIDFDYSALNLEQLDLPEYDRDVFGLPLSHWIPTAYVNKLIKATAKVKDGNNFDKNLQNTFGKFFDENPYILNIFPILFERSNYSAKEFAIKVLDWAGTSEAIKILEDFAFSQIGSDKIRHQAVMTLSRLDVISNKIKMWKGGELTELILMNFEITDEITDPYPMKPKAQGFLRKGLEAKWDQKMELSEQYFKMALEANGSDHPSLLYNLLAIGQTKGRVKDAEKQLEEITKKFPEYTFAPISLATNYAKRGKIEEAKKLTEKFYEKKKWHFSEIKVWFYFNLEFALAEKQFESARNSMKMLTNFDEDFDLQYWEDRITNLELLEKLKPLVEEKN